MMRTIALFLTTLLTATMVHAGGQETHGGDLQPGEFAMLSKHLIRRLENLPPTLRLSEDLPERLREYFGSVVVYAQDELTIDGREVAAYNRPTANPPEIHISRRLWGFVNNINNLDYENLVLHELLPGVGVDDRDYSNTIWQLEKLRTWENRNLYDRVRDFAVKDEAGVDAVLWSLKNKFFEKDARIVHLIVNKMVATPWDRHVKKLDLLASQLLVGGKSSRVQNEHIGCIHSALAYAKMKHTKTYVALRDRFMEWVSDDYCSSIRPK